MTMISSFSRLAAMMLFGASVIGAQEKPFKIEVGADVGLNFISETSGPETEHLVTLSVPVQAIRVGFFASEKLELEPKFGLIVFHTGSSTFTEYSGQLGLLYHLNSNALGDRVYVRPFLGIIGEGGSGSSDHQTIFGGGVGVKIPFAKRFATRMEAL